MFVRKGQKLGSVLVDREVAGAEPKPRKRATKKATARKAAPSAEVGSTGTSSGPHLSAKSEGSDEPKKEAQSGD